MRAAVAGRRGCGEAADGPAQRTTARRRIAPREAPDPSPLAVLAFEGNRLTASMTIGTGTLVVGRAPDCQLRLSDPLVSRHHCAIVPVPGLVLLRDLDSANGCFIDGRRMRCEPVREGCVVMLGNAVLKFVRLGSPEWRLFAAAVEPRRVGSAAHGDRPPSGSG